MRVVVLILGLLSGAESFSPRLTTSRATRSSSSFKLHVSSADAAAALSQGQAATLAEIQAALPELAPKDAQSWPAGQETIAGAPASLAAFDAPGGTSNVAWLSSLCVEGKHSSLTVLNGPLTDVPHFVSCASVNEAASTMSLFIDWRPRAYGAYEMRNEDGSYPGPETLGRDAFTYSGARSNMEAKFFTEELTAEVDNARAALGGGANGAPVNEEDKLTRGPLAIDLKDIPLSDATVAAAVAARAMAAKFWLGWQVDMDAHAHKPGAPINAQYVFDTPAKQNMYGALLAKLQGLYGEDGVRLAAADSGPLDEGYVGGGS